MKSSESVRLPLISPNGKGEDIYYEKGVEPHYSQVEVEVQCSHVFSTHIGEENLFTT